MKAEPTGQPKITLKQLVLPTRRKDNLYIDFTSLTPTKSKQLQALLTELGQLVPKLQQQLNQKNTADTLKMMWVYCPETWEAPLVGQMYQALRQAGFVKCATNRTDASVWRLWLDPVHQCGLPLPRAYKISTSLIPFVINKDGSLSVVMIKKHLAAKKFTAPGGYVDAVAREVAGRQFLDLESLEAAARRECKEETGLHINRPLKLAATFLAPNRGSDKDGRCVDDCNYTFTCIIPRSHLSSLHITDSEEICKIELVPYQQACEQYALSNHFEKCKLEACAKVLHTPGYGMQVANLPWTSTPIWFAASRAPQSLEFCHQVRPQTCKAPHPSKPAMRS